MSGDDVIRFELPGVPTGKGRPRSRLVKPKDRASFISHYTPEKTEKYERSLQGVAGQAMAGRAPLDGPIELTVTSYMPIPQSWSLKKQREARAGTLRPTGKPDWDNLAKVCDALNQVVFRDDAQVVDGHVHKVYSDRPRMMIEVRSVLPKYLDHATGEVRDAALPLLEGASA